MKAGYYLSENGNLQIWYPVGTWYAGFQTADMYQPHRGEFIRVHYSPTDIRMLLAVLEFEFLGEL
jgi:hypothetical protein